VTSESATENHARRDPCRERQQTHDRVPRSKDHAKRQQRDDRSPSDTCDPGDPPAIWHLRSELINVFGDLLTDTFDIA